MPDRDDDRPWWASEGGPRERAEPGPWERPPRGPRGGRGRDDTWDPARPHTPWDAEAEAEAAADDPWAAPRRGPDDDAVRDGVAGRRAAGPGRDWVGEATELFGQVAREAARRAGEANPRTDARAARGGEPAHRIDTCGVCPLCSLIRVVAEARPDVVEHVAEATRHLTLALKAVVDAQAAPWADRGFEHIDVD